MTEKKTRAAIVGTGAYLPEHIVTNADMEKLVDTSDEWIYTRTGIRERRKAAPDQTTSDLGAEAARQAIEDAGLTPDDITLTICSTITPDYAFPSTACLIQDKIGAKNTGGFDLSAACAGFIYGVIIGARMVEADPNQTVLVVGAETLTRITDYTDRTSCILFGDGAGAVVLRASDDGAGVMASEYGIDGSGSEFMKLPAGGSAMPASAETVANSMHYMKIAGRETFRFAVLKMAELVRNAVAESGLTMDDVKLIVPHQVNLRILQAAADRLDIDIDKIYCNIDKIGNTSAASAAIALDEAARKGAIEKGDAIVLVAFGGGLSWSSAVVRW
jgi:3-oxoacyl-[acyl-carrier-protein] synthase III